MRDAALAVLAERVGPARATPKYRGGEHLLVPNLVDIHNGLLAWGEECGEDFDSRIARRDVEGVVDEMLSQALMYGIEQIILPVGQDLMHADIQIGGKGGATTKGTPQDVDSRAKLMYRNSVGMMVWVIDRCRQHAPVRVVGTPGNHAREREWMLVEQLGAIYAADDAVEVVNPVAPRSYQLYHEVLLGFGHLDREKEIELPSIMAREAAQYWSVSSWREWLGGHQHRIKVTEIQGVRIRRGPSITATDSYHVEHGYFHNRCAEGLIYDHGGFRGLANARVNRPRRGAA